MDKWGFNPSSVSAAGTVVATIALIVAIVGAYHAYQQGRRDRNLQAFLTLSSDIRQRWESDWGHLLRDELPKLNLHERHSGEVGLRVVYMLNWLDWMGLILRMELIDRELLLGSIGPSIVQMLRQSAHLIQRDIDDPEKGAKWWANVLYIAALPEINVNIQQEAAALRGKWGDPQLQDDSAGPNVAS